MAVLLNDLGIVLALVTMRVCKCRTCRTNLEIKSGAEVTCPVSHFSVYWIENKLNSWPNSPFSAHFVSLTLQVGFSAADAVTGLKLVEEGVPKEHLALLAVPMVPLQIILPLIISKYTAGPQPLNTFYKAMPYR